MKTHLATSVVVLLTSISAFANQGSGVVNFQGTVINAPCGIDPTSVDQSIDFGQISKSHLAAGGTSLQKSLDIKLVNCDVSALATKGVAVTFSGNTVTGTATELITAGNTNTAVVINGYGADIIYGSPTDNIKLNDGNNTLHFTSWTKQATGMAVAEGDFSAVANFNLTYQ
jgi:major pilin subunit PapA